MQTSVMARFRQPQSSRCMSRSFRLTCPELTMWNAVTMKKLLLLLSAFVVASCVSSHHTYQADSISLKKGKSTYYVKNVTVNLTLGHGAIPGDTSFSNKEELEKQFAKSLSTALKRKGQLASDLSNADAELEITIDYKRTFNYGGKALNKPQISHLVNIYKDGEKLVSLNQNNYTTKYSYFKEIAVNAEIASFNWGADDELQDINLISESIADEISNVGS